MAGYVRKAYKDSDDYIAQQKTNQALEKAYQDSLKAAQAPSQYADAYKAAISEYNQKPQFSYDMASDALYNQYKNQYMDLGKKAAENVAAQSANLTGGYGNSYGTVASNQAYQDYLGKLNDIVPQLEQQARANYNDGLNAILNRISVLGSADQQEYARNQDAVNSALQALQLGMNKADSIRNFDYAKYTDEENQKENNYWNALRLAASKSSGSKNGSSSGTASTKDIENAIAFIRKNVLAGNSKAPNASFNDSIADALEMLGFGADTGVGRYIYENLYYDDTGVKRQPAKTTNREGWNKKYWD